MNMNKFSITLIAGALAAFMAATAPAQMISTQYAKKLVLADASASLVPLTLRAPAALTGAYSLTFPNAAPTSNGYLLSSATDGTLSWVDPTSYAFLTGVSHGATLTGAGTSGSPLDINLGNTNSWTAVQSFLANNAQGNVFVAAINAAASTINAVSVGIGLTDAQVSDNLTISGGTVNNTPIGTTTASTGRFTTITGTSLPASSSSTDIVTSNGGDLETRTATTNATANTIVLRDNSGNFSAGTITAFLNGNVNGNINGNAVGFSGSLAGDVTGTQAATAVSLVGGSSATNVHSAELLANAATNLNTASTIVKRDGSGNFSAGTVTAALTGNASTATTLQTTHAIYGNNFNGSADLTQVIASTYGGTGNGFTKFTGPAASEKTFTLPNASATILTDNAVVTIAQGGTNSSTALNNGKLMVSSGNKIVEGTSSSAPSFTSATLSGTTNQLVLGGTNAITITAPAPGSSRTYTLDDAGANARFALTSATPVNGALPKWNGTTGNLTNSSINDNGTTISTSEMVSVSANVSNDALSVTNSNTSGTAANISSAATADGLYALKASATGNGAGNELYGVWGVASNQGTANTASIGVFAQGNKNTTAGQTNIALQITEGQLTMGRETDADGVSGTVIGPSGTVDITVAAPAKITTSGNNINGGPTVTTSTATNVSQKYANSTSIVICTVLDGGTATIGAGEQVSVRVIRTATAGRFQLVVSRSCDAQAGPGTGASNGTVRIGYMVINANK
jgi:hypothetical protein